MSVALDLNVDDINEGAMKAIEEIQNQVFKKINDLVVPSLLEEFKKSPEVPEKDKNLRRSIKVVPKSVSRGGLEVEIIADAKNKKGKEYLKWILEGQSASSSRGRYVPEIGKRRKTRDAKGKFVRSVGRYPKNMIRPNDFPTRVHDSWVEGEGQEKMKQLTDWINSQFSRWGKLKRKIQGAFGR